LNNAPAHALGLGTVLSVTFAEDAKGLVSGSWYIVAAVNTFFPVKI
jgi:hypothetical protein